MPITVISTPKYNLSLLVPKDLPLMLNYLSVNKHFLTPWEPLRNESYYSENEILMRIKNALLRFKQQTALNFVILNKDDSEILGVCNFSNVLRGPLQCCHLGYSVAKIHNGKGIMHESLNAAIDYAFNEFMIHRIMANYLPHNHRSENVLKKLGFEREGYAKSYLEIQGKWQDHVLTALVNPKQR